MIFPISDSQSQSLGDIFLRYYQDITKLDIPLSAATKPAPSRKL